ncbi:MAG: ABC transporter ATP-binding protein [Lentisphaeria bacterium]|nr:ABC transporter ATP-binding protein [Lentisphaeria bacterium]
MIALNHVGYGYPGKTVLEDVTLTVEAGAMICLLGPSGIGKSTILDIVAGLRHPRTGSRRVATRRIGYAFQEPHLLPWRTVLDNVRIGLAGWFQRPDAETRAWIWLERLGLTECAGRRPAELSGGMRRRVNLARALAADADLLLLDEPFAFLDPAVIERVRHAVGEEHRRGKTVVMVTHVQEQVAALEPRVVPLTRAPVRLPEVD